MAKDPPQLHRHTAQQAMTNKIREPYQRGNYAQRARLAYCSFLQTLSLLLFFRFLHHQFLFCSIPNCHHLSLFSALPLNFLAQRTTNTETHQPTFFDRKSRLITCAFHWAHGVVVSHPLSMREALGSIPSVSKLCLCTSVAFGGPYACRHTVLFVNDSCGVQTHAVAD